MVRVYACKCGHIPVVYERKLFNRTLYKITCSSCNIDVYAFSINKMLYKWNKKMEKCWRMTPYNDWWDDN